MWISYLVVVFFTIGLTMFVMDRRNIIYMHFIMAGLVALALFILRFPVSDATQPWLLLLKDALLWVRIALPLAFAALGLGFIWNGFLLIRREHFKFLYFLLVICGVGMVSFVIMVYLNDYWLKSVHLGKALTVISYGIGFFGLTFIGFILASALYRIVPVRYNKDFILVLGAGLFPDGKVTPLLAQRLDKAAKFYWKQLVRNGKAAKIITSGGQGIDEPIPEALAMRNYLVNEKGIPANLILMEDQSANTQENFQFSKQLMNQEKTIYSVAFVTNEFHVLRSSIFSRKASLDAEGLGSRTALYYIPFAMIREYCALLWMNWRSTLIGLFFSLVLGLTRI